MSRNALGLPPIVATPKHISGQGLNCLYRCLTEVLRASGGANPIPSTAELRTTLARFVSENPHTRMDPLDSYSEDTFEDGVHDLHPSLLTAAYASSWQIPGNR